MTGPAKIVPKTDVMMIAKLAVKMMFYDRYKLIGSLFGVVFAVFLANQQLATYLGLVYKNQMFVENTHADFWILPPSLQTLQAADPISLSTVLAARGVEGVEWAEPLLLGTAVMQKPDGGTEGLTLIGTQLEHMAGGPWNLVAGAQNTKGDFDARQMLSVPYGVIVEDSQRVKLGDINLGDEREMNGYKIAVTGFTWGLIPFGPSYGFTAFDNARQFLRVDSDRASFGLVKLKKGADAEMVRKKLLIVLKDVQVISKAEFKHSIWMYLRKNTQIGVTFGISTAFAIIVGFVIVALTMFSAVVDNIREFGTLKALGMRTRGLALLLTVQAILYSAVGTTIGSGLAMLAANAIRGPMLVLIRPWELVVGSYVLMTLVCVIASLLALVRVAKVEPGMVFR